MKKLITSLLLFLISVNLTAQSKYWLSGNYSKGMLDYFNNGKVEKIGVNWKNAAPTVEGRIVVFGEFKKDDSGKEYFSAEGTGPQVNLLKGSVKKQKFNCSVSDQEGVMTLNSGGKKGDFVSFVPVQDNATISVARADWGTKICDNKRYGIYYIQQIQANAVPTNSGTNGRMTQERTPENTNVTSSQISSQEAKEALDFHNKARSEVGVEPLVWSATLSNFAQQWADHLVANNNCKLEHRPDSGEWKQRYGENIAMQPPQGHSAKDASAQWYDEIDKFQNVVLNDHNWFDAGHYSQMIWRKTKAVGMGAAKCSNGYYIVVANYDPAGNFMGEKAY